MRLLLLIGAVLLLVPCSGAAVAYVQSDGAFTQTSAATSTQTDTLTHTSTLGNDLAVSFTQLSTTVHVTYVCGGTSCTQSSFTSFFAPYSGLPTNTGSGNQVWICHKCPATSVITVKTSGNGVFVTLVEEYSGVKSIIQVSSATGTSTTPTISLNIVNANDFIFGSFSSRGSSGVPTSGTGTLRDAARSGTTTSFNAGGAVDNTSGTAGTSVTVSETITSTNDTWTAIAIELSGVTQSTPTDFIRTYSSEDPGGNETANYGTDITFPMVPDPVLAGNTVICSVGWSVGAGTISAHTLTTFNGSNVDTMTKDVEEDSATSSLAIFHVAATTGVNYVVYHFTTGLVATNKLVSSCSEHNNIVTASSPTDVTCGATALSPPNLSCGSETPTASNDLLFVAGMLDGSNSYAPGVYYMSPGYQFAAIVANNVVGTFTESFIDPNTSAINPSMYMGVVPGANIVAANTFNIAGVAYKTTSTGTVPSGQYIARELVFDYLGATFAYQNCPSTGNFNSYMFANGQETTQGLKIWDSNQVSYTWNQPNTTTFPDIGLLDTSSNSTLDPTSACLFDHVEAGNDETMARDIYNISTSTPFDTPTCPAGGSNTSGNAQGATGCYNTQAQSGGTATQSPILKPSVSTSTLSLFSGQNGVGPAFGVSNVTGIILDCPIFTAQTDVDPLCEGNMYAHVYATSTTNQSVTWTVANVANTVNSVGYDLNAVASAATQLPQIFVIRP